MRLRCVWEPVSYTHLDVYKRQVYDTQKQLHIAFETHMVDHQGINRVTSKLAESYHWKGIKQTVIQVIAACTKCQDNNGNKGLDESIVIDTRNDPNGHPRTIVHAIPQDNMQESLEALEELTPRNSTQKSRLKTSFVQRIKFGKEPGSEKVKRKAIVNPDESMNSFTQYAQEHINSFRKRSKHNDGRGSEPGTVILEEDTPNSCLLYTSRCV